MHGRSYTAVRSGTVPEKPARTASKLKTGPVVRLSLTAGH